MAPSLTTPKTSLCTDLSGFIAPAFITLHRCCIFFYKLKARLFTKQNDYNSHYYNGLTLL